MGSTRPVLRRLRNLPIPSGVEFDLRIDRSHRQHRMIAVPKLALLDYALQPINGGAEILEALTATAPAARTRSRPVRA